MESETHSQLWVIPWVSEKTNKQNEMFIRKLDEVVRGNPKDSRKLKKKRTRDDLAVL